MKVSLEDILRLYAPVFCWTQLSERFIPLHLVKFFTCRIVCLSAGVLYFRFIQIKVNPALIEPTPTQGILHFCYMWTIHCSSSYAQNSLTRSRLSIYNDSKEILTVYWVNSPYFGNPYILICSLNNRTDILSDGL